MRRSDRRGGIGRNASGRRMVEDEQYCTSCGFRKRGSLRDQLTEVLGDIRASLAADENGAPVKPPLLVAERKILELLFTKKEMEEYDQKRTS